MENSRQTKRIKILKVFSYQHREMDFKLNRINRRSIRVFIDGTENFVAELWNNT